MKGWIGHPQKTSFRARIGGRGGVHHYLTHAVDQAGMKPHSAALQQTGFRLKSAGTRPACSPDLFPPPSFIFTSCLNICEDFCPSHIEFQWQWWLFKQQQIPLSNSTSLSFNSVILYLWPRDPRWQDWRTECLNLSLFVCLSRFGLRPRDYISRAAINREGQWSECEAGMPVLSGPRRHRPTGYRMELDVLWQPERG